MNNVNEKKLIGRLNIYRSVLILLVIYIFAIISPPSFLSVANLFNMFKQTTVTGIVGCGTAFVILTGRTDPSVGSILGLVNVLTSDILESTDNAGVAIPVVLAVGMGRGAVNGFFMAVCEIPPFISILSMMTLPRGYIPIYTKSSPIPIKVGGYEFFGKGIVAGVPVPIIIFITLFFIAHYVLIQASCGRSIYVLGGDRETARLPGISVRFTEWTTYTLNGFICGVVGAIPTVRLGSVQSTSGIGTEMDVIAAVTLGGASLSDGMGSALPTVVGAMIMGVIDNVLTLINVDPHTTNIVKDAVILIAVLADRRVKDLSAKME